MEYTYFYGSPLGVLRLTADGEALTELTFADGENVGGSENAALPCFQEAIRWLDIYFSGGKPGFLPRLHLHTTAFREAVCRRMLEIPYGETVSYGALAKELAEARGLAHMSAQAVGGAVGHNPIAIIIPCHRVVGTDGSLTGYAFGLKKKIALLSLEGTDMSGLYVPKKGTKL